MLQGPVCKGFLHLLSATKVLHEVQQSATAAERSIQCSVFSIQCRACRGAKCFFPRPGVIQGTTYNKALFAMVFCVFQVQQRYNRTRPEHRTSNIEL